MDAQHLGVLEREALLGLDLEVGLLEECTVHAAQRMPRGRRWTVGPPFARSRTARSPGRMSPAWASALASSSGVASAAGAASTSSPPIARSRFFETATAPTTMMSAAAAMP
jgi:hypothetical protein